MTKAIIGVPLYLSNTILGVTPHPSVIQSLLLTSNRELIDVYVLVKTKLLSLELQDNIIGKSILLI